MKNLNLVNRGRLEEILTLLAFECSDIREVDNVLSCHDCPYKEACDALNRIEITLIDNSAD